MDRHVFLAVLAAVVALAGCSFDVAAPANISCTTHDDCVGFGGICIEDPARSARVCCAGPACRSEVPDGSDTRADEPAARPEGADLAADGPPEMSPPSIVLFDTVPSS